MLKAIFYASAALFVLLAVAVALGTAHGAYGGGYGLLCFFLSLLFACGCVAAADHD